MKKIASAIWEYCKATDKLLWLFCLSASAFSLVLLSSMQYNHAVEPGDISMPIQTIAVLLGIISALVVSAFDYHLLAKLWKLHVPLTVFLVLLTYTPLGITPSGTKNKAWLSLFGITTFQPSELLKISFILTFALHLSKIKGKINSPRNLFPLILHGMIPIGMILLQRDVGSALVFGAIFVMMLFVAGLSWKIVIASLGAVIVAAPIVWQSDLLNEFQKQRILVIFNPELDLLNYGYQQWRGRISLGSGQLFGRGLFTGSSSFVPVVHNDFIFAYIGQVLGFVGCVATAALLLCICIRILVNSMRAKDALGCYICTGVFAIMIFQSVVNIGMVLCVMPVIGVTLPFISCGGTSVVTMYLAMGLVMSVHAYSKRKKKFFED